MDKLYMLQSIYPWDMPDEYFEPFIILKAAGQFCKNLYKLSVSFNNCDS